MLPKGDVFQYIHRGDENLLQIKVADVWNNNPSSQTSDMGMQKARKCMLEKFDFFPAPDQVIPNSILIHVQGCRGKFLKNGVQTDIWSIINPTPNPGVPNMPVIYQYQPFVLDWVDIGPYETEMQLRFTDENDEDIVFKSVYTIQFSISNGYEL